jgi:heterodisulfide reductase subunit B
MQYTYYPGCTAETTAYEFGRSTEAACEALDIELIELEDWNCCGATSAHSMSLQLNYELSARTVGLGQAARLDMAVACPGCYQRVLNSDHRLRTDEAFCREMEQVLGFEYNGQAQIRHLLDILTNDVSLDMVRQKVVKSLEGLKPVPYYGCVLVRPPALTGWDDPEHPTLMDGVLDALGAKVMHWSHKVDCCGASLALNRSDIVKVLCNQLVDDAIEAGANCLVTVCGMCHINLDTRQKDQNLPIFYLTELMGLAFGSPTKDVIKWMKKHVADGRPLLESLELL